MKKLKQNILATVFAICSTAMLGQTYPCYGTSFGNSTQSMPPNCTNSSPAYLNKYQLPQTFIPTASDPIITLKITLHIFTDNNGNGIFENTNSSYNGLPALNTMLSLITNGNTDRFSEKRSATYASAFIPPFLNDSRIKYEVTNIYFYPNTTLYTANWESSLYTHINTYYPGRLEEGMPILINNGGFDGHLSSWNGAPAIATTWPDPADTMFYRAHLRHEIAHSFGLGHTYKNTLGGGSDWQNFNAACGSIDYLTDVFPGSMTHCPVDQSTNPPYPNPPTNACLSCFEFGDNLFSNVSTNVLGGQANNKWMSPIQIGRRYRMMHLTTTYPHNLRVFAKDMVSQHTNPWLISSNETWDFDIQMYKDIVVKAGNTLTIKCKVAMAIDGKIKIEKGAQLLIDGGEITGWCKTGLWKGIEVDGTSSQHQNYSGGYATYQGILQIINGGTLRNAQNAICTYTTDVNGNMDANSTGGVVLCSNANFINNMRTAEFYYYYSPNGGNKSYFIKCNFNTVSTIPTGALPGCHVTLFNVDGVRFLGCNFEYSAGNAYPAGSRGNGIYSIDAKYFVDQYCNNPKINPCTNFTKTEFKNLENGIYADNSNPLRVVSVTNTNFFDVLNYSTYFNIMNTFVFENNYVRTPGTGYSTALYLNNCRYYNVKNNTFLGNSGGAANSDAGVYINNSLTGAHKVYRNSFANFNVALGPMNNNSGITNSTDGLKMNCNDFTPVPNKYDIALMGSSPTVMRDQGKAFGPYTALDLVRNRYAAPYISSNFETKWYIQTTSVKGYNHPSNSDLNTQPLPQPAFSDVAVIVVNSGIPYNSSHCPVTEAVGGGPVGGRLATINNNISSLFESEKDVVSNGKIKKGASFELQAAVAEKLNYFLTDTLLSSKDSVIALLKYNHGQMEDADAQLTYAYMDKGDFTKAMENVNSIRQNKPKLADLQATLIGMNQNQKNAFTFKTNAGAQNFLKNYIAGEDNEGRGSAQSMLKFTTGEQYFIPRLLPLIEDGINKSVNNDLTSEGGNANNDFNVYPNPASNLINLIYKGISENPIHYTLVNVLGDIVYEADIKSESKAEIALNNFTNGVYLLSCFDGKTKVFQTKVVKVN